MSAGSGSPPVERTAAGGSKAITRAPAARAISGVPSVLPVSTRSTSSANASARRHWAIPRASSRATTTAESCSRRADGGFGSKGSGSTGEILLQASFEISSTRSVVPVPVPVPVPDPVNVPVKVGGDGADLEAAAHRSRANSPSSVGSWCAAFTE